MDKGKPNSNRQIQHSPNASEFTKPSLSYFNIAEKWLQSHSIYVVVSLCCLALIPRALYFQQARNSPIQAFTNWKQSDMDFFNSWAKVIASGNWMTDTILHPYHLWHDEFSKITFETYPDVSEAYYTLHSTAGSQIDTIAARRHLINDIYQNKVFHQEPLYPYLIALTYTFFGADPNHVYVWQMLIGVLTILLTYCVGTRLFSASAGLLAALFILISGPLLVYEMVLLRTTLTVFFTVLLLYMMLRVQQHPNKHNMLYYGIISGLALLCQSYFLVFLAISWIWLIWKLKSQEASSLKLYAFYIGAFLFIMSFVFYRNYKLGAPVLSLASNAAMTYIPFNCSSSYPLEPFHINIYSLVEIMHNTKGKIAPTIIECMSTFKNFEDFFRIYKQKLEGILMSFELANNMNYYCYKEFSNMLKNMPAPYVILAPLGIAGVLLGLWRNRSKSIPIFIMLLVSLIPMIIGGCFSRYRAPLSLVFAITSAYFATEYLKMILHRTWKPLIYSSLVAVALFIFTSGQPRSNPTIFPYLLIDFRIIYNDYYKKRLLEFEKQNNYYEHDLLTREMIGYFPDYFFKVKTKDRIQSTDEVDCSNFIVNILDMNTTVCKILGKNQQAAENEGRIEILRKRVLSFQNKSK